jgi:DNA-binding beta-propeller fold protein YncE
MPHARRLTTASLVIIAASAALPPAAIAQADMLPTNNLPNPYRTVEGWARMPEGRTWGSTSAVEIDRDGTSIWVAERCGANSCVGSTLDPVLKFDASGNLVKSFGSGMFVSPHGIFVDRDGNIWVTDCACTAGGGGRGRGGAGRGDSAGRGAAPAAPAPPSTVGHQVYKFSPDGKLLLTMGKAGGAREPDYFFQPNDVLVAPNGDIFVSEGHSSGQGSTARVLKFSKDGTLIASWGHLGNGPNDYDQPHALAMDSRGRLFVGDRGNNRIKILDQDGKLLDTWYQFSRPSGIWIDKDDNIYVADSESGSVARTRTEWKRGIRIGSAKDGSVVALIPDPNENATNTSAAEGVAVDAHGIIYGAEVGPKALKRYEKK